MKITPQQLEPYFYKNKKHEAYELTCKLYNDLKKHANGEDMGDIISERRPSESDNIKNYRSKIQVAITKGEGVGLVIATMGKIRRSPDWAVKFEGEVPARIKEDETPEKYFNHKYPYYDSITNWCFSVLMKEYLVDANGVILIMPLEESAPSDYLNPLPIIFNSDQIYELNNEWALLKSKENSYYNEGTMKWEGNVFYVVTDEEIVRYSQQPDKTYRVTREIDNPLGKLPIVHMFGVYYKNTARYTIWESRIQGMVPRLTEYVREFSDMQAEIVQHVHSEKYSFVQQACTSCESTGRIKKNNKNVICPECKGTGSVVTSPYNSTYSVRMAKTNLGEQQIPTPPIGYIQKSTDIAKLQDERVEKHMYKAFCSISMQHLFQMPLNESGYKKELDMDESITMVHNVAEDVVRICDKVIQASIDWRYGAIVENEEERKQLYPFIPVPEKFDIISTNYLMEEVQKAKTSQLNPSIIQALEKEIAVKKFYTDKETKDTVLNIIELDPLPFPVEQKMTLFADGVITEEDYIISTYIQQFVKRAVRENKDFFTLEYDQKREILEGYADEMLAEQKEKMMEVEESKKEEPIDNG